MADSNDDEFSDDSIAYVLGNKRRASPLPAQDEFSDDAIAQTLKSKPVKAASHQTRLVKPGEVDSAAIGFKSNDADRTTAAKERFPDAKNVYTDNEGTVTVESQDGSVRNFEKPDFGQAIAGSLRGIFGLDKELRQSNSTVRDAIESNAAAALPNIATRGAANTLAGFFSGGASLPAQVGINALTNGAVPGINKAINEMTAGGDTESGGAVGLDTAKDAAIGAAATLAPTALAGLLKRGSRIAGDVGRAAKSAAGVEPAVDVARAADALGVAEGAVANPEMQALLDQPLVRPEQFSPSAFNKASPSAPDAMAKIAKTPRVQVAEAEGKAAARQAFASVGDMPWHADPETFQAVASLRNGKLPQESFLSSLFTAGSKNFGPVGTFGRELATGKSQNLMRAMGDPAKKAELAQLIAQGRAVAPGSSASREIEARIVNLIGEGALDSTP